MEDPGGVWTGCWGHTVGVVAGETFTMLQCKQLLAQDLAIFEHGVGAVARSPSSNEFSAMVSLAMNIGLGKTNPPAGFLGSTVLRQHNAGNKAAAADAFLLWHKGHVDGELVDLPGLDIRRAAERKLYLTPDTRAA